MSTEETVQTSGGELTRWRSPSLGEVQSLFQALGVTEHPILELPTGEQVAGALGTEEGKAELIERLRLRQRRIKLAVESPLEWGFEAGTWEDADALLKGTWSGGSGERGASERGASERGGAAADRPRTGGEGECEVLAIFGGNRAQKSVYAVKRGCQTADLYARTTLLMGAETELASIKTVQALVWWFLGPKYKHLNGRRDAVVKFTYSQGEGFTNRKLVLPNGSEIHFPTYNQDPGIYEGWEFGAPVAEYERVSQARRGQGLFVPPNIGAVMDESMPLKWLKMLGRRVRFRKAKVLWPFTPVKGITPAVKELVGSSAVTLESRRSELLPRKNLPEVPAGEMPYIRKCALARAYAIYFFTVYNKWGPGPGGTYYDEIKQLCAGKESQYVERVAYGFARDSVARAFPKFGSWNIIQRRHLPASGTNYFFCDPAGARNWFMLWVRVAGPRWGDGKWTHYIYRDWPEAQRFGEWAVVTEREVSEEASKGWDGDAGPAQAGLGYGVTKYKETILECERVKIPSFNSQPSGNIQASKLTEQHEALIQWMERNGEDPYRVKLVRRALGRGEALDQVREEVAERYVDPRAGASEHIAEQGGTCIMDEFAEVQRDGNGRVTGPSMELTAASGVNEEEGLGMVNELLDWNTEAPLVGLLNEPHLYVSEECEQVRWMFENYTGRAGGKGACKDPADLARYMALAKLEDTSGGMVKYKPGKGF